MQCSVREDFFDQLHRCMAVGKVRPGQLYEKLIIITFYILLAEIVKIFPVGFVFLKKRVKCGKSALGMVLRITVPQHVETVEGIGCLWLFVNRWVHGGLLLSVVESSIHLWGVHLFVQGWRATSRVPLQRATSRVVHFFRGRPLGWYGRVGLRATSRVVHLAQNVTANLRFASCELAFLFAGC